MLRNAHCFAQYSEVVSFEWNMWHNQRYIPSDDFKVNHLQKAALFRSALEEVRGGSEITRFISVEFKHAL